MPEQGGFSLTRRETLIGKDGSQMEQVRLSARELAEFLLRSGSIDSRFAGFDRAQEGARIHRKLQAEYKKEAGSDYKSEVALKIARTVSEVPYLIEGRADGVFTGTDGVRTVDEIKSTAGQIERELHPEHWAQAKIYAAALCELEGLERVRVQLTYFQVDEEEIVRYQEELSAEQAEGFLCTLLEQYAPWAKREESWREQRRESLSALAFPFAAYRPGQRAMAGEIFRAFRDGQVLLCQAPTGIGKSMSTIFPALKALGAGHGDRIFYLTARGTTAAAAENAVRLIREASAPRLRSITLTSKEKLCFLDERDCTPESCPYADGYYNRLRQGLHRALEEESYTRADIERLAKELVLCPFEFQLDLSLWCDLLIGDYNYLFDPVVSLKRYFESKGDYLFLVDEAHNLPDRARDMYSSALFLSAFRETIRLLGRKKSRLKTRLQEAADSLTEMYTLCMQEENHTFFQQLPPESLLQTLARLEQPMQAFLEEHKEGEQHDGVLELYFQLQDFLRVAERYDDHYITQCSAWGKEAGVYLLCLDPSDFLAESFSLGRSAVLFSATLSPPDYYKNVLGCAEARCIALPSPFPRENLGLFIARGVSTRYKDRERSAGTVADYLYAMIAGRVGNYMAYFPSYAYLDMVLDRFQSAHPEVETLVQQTGMDDAARAEFLSAFSEEPAQTLLGFGVMGGVFGEGIDLTGSRLIGTAVVGVGLPMVSPRQEKLREYCGENFGDGFDYAYRYPGMNKVLQAAGRVIRTDTDRGVVLLIDDRYLQPDYRALCPPHWDGARLVRTPEELTGLERQFWG